ncbi:MAG: glycosyltransferase family 39 protein, partial [Planctomycetota bacterium]
MQEDTEQKSPPAQRRPDPVGPRPGQATPLLGTRRDLSGRAVLPLLLVILAWSALWRVAFIQGWAASDDAVYAMCALQLNSGERFNEYGRPLVDNRAVRVSYIAAAAAWMGLFGRSEAAVCSLDVVSGVMGVAALYWVASLIAGRRVALWAALLKSSYPPDLIYDGIVFPDHFGLLWMLLVLGAFLKALTSRNPRRWLWIVLGGVALAVAVSARETAVIVGAVLVLVGVCARRWRRARIGLAICGVGLLVFMLEFPVLRAATGDWLYRLHAAAQSFGEGGMHVQRWRWAKALFYPATLMLRQDLVSIYGWLLIGGFRWALVNRRRYGLVLIWTIAVWLFLEYGSTSLQSHRPMPKDPRLMGPVTVLLFIPLAELVTLLLARAGSARWAVWAVMGGVVFNGIFTANQNTRPLYWADHPRALRAALALRAQGGCPPLVLPESLYGNIYFSDQETCADLPRIDLSGHERNLPTAGMMLYQAYDRGLVIPVEFFRLMRIHRRHGRVRPADYREFLEASARTIP